MCKGLKGESNRRVSGGCEVILCSALCFLHTAAAHTGTRVHTRHVFLFYPVFVHACLCACVIASCLTLSQQRCMRTSRCRRGSLQPRSLESSFNLRSALCPADLKTTVVSQSHILLTHKAATPSDCVHLLPLCSISLSSVF